MTLICSRAVATLRCSTVSFAIRPTFYFLKILSGDGPIATILGYVIFFLDQGKRSTYYKPFDFVILFPRRVRTWWIFTRLKLWIASARHNFKWVKIQHDISNILLQLIFISMKYLIHTVALNATNMVALSVIKICNIDLAVWGRARYLSVTDAPHNIESINTMQIIISYFAYICFCNEQCDEAMAWPRKPRNRHTFVYFICHIHQSMSITSILHNGRLKAPLKTFLAY